MLGMSSEQWLALLRQVLPMLGGMAIALGWLTVNQVSELSAALLGAVGPLTILGSAVWAIYLRKKSEIIKSAAAIPEVKKITLDPASPETKDLNQATPHNVVVATVGEVK